MTAELAQSHPERSDIVARSGAKPESSAGAFQSRHNGLELSLAQWPRAQDERRGLPHIVVNKAQALAVWPPPQTRINLLHFRIPPVAEGLADFQDVQIEDNERVVVCLRIITQNGRLFVAAKKRPQRISVPSPKVFSISEGNT